MRWMLASAISCALLLGRADASDQEQCFATLSPPGSPTSTIQLDDFSVIANDKPLRLPDGLTDVAAITCRRSSLFMSDSDYHVLTDLHLPFAFSDGNRVVWLYVENQRLLMHMDRGELSKTEREQIETTIQRSQETMLRQGW